MAIKTLARKLVLGLIAAAMLAGLAGQAYATYCTTNCYNIGSQRYCNTSCY